MNPFLIWFIAYILPVLMVLSLMMTIPNAKRGTILRSIINIAQKLIHKGNKEGF